MKSFSPIFLSLMKAAEIGTEGNHLRQRGRHHTAHMLQRFLWPIRQENQSVSVDAVIQCWGAQKSCNRVGLRVVHRPLMLRAMHVMQPLGSVVQRPDVMGNIPHLHAGQPTSRFFCIYLRLYFRNIHPQLISNQNRKGFAGFISLQLIFN